MGKKTSFYQSDELEKVLSKYVKRYGSMSGAVTNLILGMDTIYRLERRVLRDLFTQREINLMLNNALSTDYNPQHTTDAVLHDTQDEVQSNFDYFEVDRDILLNKLRNLTVSQQYALVDWLLEMREHGSAVFMTIENLKDWLEFDGISEERAAEVCGTSIEVIRQWIANPATVPQEAIKMLNMEKFSASSFYNRFKGTQKKKG